MGSIVPIAAQTAQASQTAGTIASTISAGANVLNAVRGGDQSLSSKQLAQRQAIEERNVVEQANVQRQELFEKARVAEDERRKALKRAISRQRAQFGSSGISSNSGSSEAVLLGFFDESDDQRQSRENLDQIRLAAIDQKLSQVKRVNTLKRTQQDSQNKLKEISQGALAAKNLFSIF